MSETIRCYIDRNNGVRYQRQTHRIDCADTNCRGCKPCPEPRHCTAGRGCSWHVEAGLLTCGRCVGKARRNLQKIASHAALMLPAAIEDGIESESANLAGPVPDPRWAAELRVAQMRHLTTWHTLGRITENQALAALEALPEDDPRHPGNLMRWQMMIAEDYGHDLPPRLTISGAAAYLDRQLHRIANDEEQDFPLLASELRKCRQHVEVTLATAERPERGAPCPECTSDETGVGPRLVREYPHWCEDPNCTRLHYSTRYDADAETDEPDETGDRWVCPRVREHWWSAEGYGEWLRERQEHTKRERMGA